MKTKIRTREIVYFTFTILTVAILLTPNYAELSVINSVKENVVKVIPSLFPFMVISGVLCDAGVPKPVRRLFYPICKILNLPTECACVMITGNLCGFPVGAASASRLYETGVIDKRSAEKVFLTSNNVSLSFAVSYAGAALFSSAKLGLIMWISQFASSLIICFILSRFDEKKRYMSDIREKNEDCYRFSKSFTHSVKKAAESSLSVAAFIAFFSVLNTYTAEFFSRVGLEKISSFTSLFLEITSSCKVSTQYVYPYNTALCAFSLGFSCLCVICQCTEYIVSCEVSTVKIMFLKFLQGVLSFFMTLILCSFIDFEVKNVSDIVYVPKNALFATVSTAILLLYIIIKVKDFLCST